jgi:hypothetical protein
MDDAFEPAKFGRGSEDDVGQTLSIEMSVLA